MGRLSTLEPQQKKKDRVNVFIDGEFAFGISAELAYLNKLKTGKTLSQKEIKDLIQKDQVERLSNKALRFLGYRPHSEKEVRDYLRFRGKLKDLETEEEKEEYLDSIEQVLNKLKKLKFLNDKEFSLWWVKERGDAKQISKRILKNELATKGVDKEIIEEVLQSGESEEEKALKVASKKAKTLKGENQQDFRIKLGQFLARKGFSWEVIKKIVDSYRQND